MQQLHFFPVSSYPAGILWTKNEFWRVTIKFQKCALKQVIYKLEFNKCTF